MEIEKVRVIRREAVTYRVKVKGPTSDITLFIDEDGNAHLHAHYSKEAGSELAKFNAAYLPQVHAAIGAVLEAMGEDA